MFILNQYNLQLILNFGERFQNSKVIKEYIKPCLRFDLTLIKDKQSNHFIDKIITETATKQTKV